MPLTKAGFLIGKKKILKKKRILIYGKDFLKIYKEFPKVKFVWIKGHAGHPKNERCDKLAVLASETSDQLTDSYYEEIIKNPDTLF